MEGTAAHLAVDATHNRPRPRQQAKRRRLSIDDDAAAAAEPSTFVAIECIDRGGEALETGRRARVAAAFRRPLYPSLHYARVWRYAAWSENAHPGIWYFSPAFRSLSLSLHSTRRPLLLVSTALNLRHHQASKQASERARTGASDVYDLYKPNRNETTDNTQRDLHQPHLLPLPPPDRPSIAACEQLRAPSRPAVGSTQRLVGRSVGQKEAPRLVTSSTRSALINSSVVVLRRRPASVSFAIRPADTTGAFSSTPRAAQSLSGLQASAWGYIAVREVKRYRI